MSSVYFNLSNFEGKILNFAFRRFFEKWFDKYDDIAPLGYIALLEHKKDYENIEDENQKFWRAVSYCSAGMQKFFDNFEISHFDFISLSELTERHTDTYAICNNIKECEDYNFLKDLFKSVLSNYSLKDKKILVDYMFNELSKTIIYKKYNIDLAYLKHLLVTARQTYFNKLVENNYFRKSDPINFYKGFEKVKKLPDKLICKLLKENNIPIEDISRVSGVDVDKVQKILIHTNCKLKFFLYQIQKLRKVYFPNYSLEELAK